VAGRLGYCGKDRTRAVLTGDEVRDCWQAERATPEPFLGLFGSLYSPAPPPVRVEAPWPAAPTASVVAQRTWNAIVAGGTREDPITARSGSVAVAARPVRERGSATRPARPLPAWLEARTSLATTGPVGAPDALTPTPAAPATTPRPAAPATAPTGSALLPVIDTLDVPQVVDAETLVRRDMRTHASLATPALATPPLHADPVMPARTVTTWSAAAPVAAAPSVLPAPSVPAITRWRHPSIDERAALPAVPPAMPPAADDATGRRTSALSLFPATLANRLRQHLGTRGLRALATPEGQAPVASSVPLAASPRERQPFATARPSGPGRLVEAPTVPPVMSLGDQLRRAEQIRRERALLDAAGLRDLHGRDPRA